MWIFKSFYFVDFGGLRAENKSFGSSIFFFAGESIVEIFFDIFKAFFLLLLK